MLGIEFNLVVAGVPQEEKSKVSWDRFLRMFPYRARSQLLTLNTFSLPSQPAAV